ncbi:MAG: GMC family oxidoreductase [Vicinamibacterales bacterium]
MTQFALNTPVDFLVVGVGAAGGVMAKELSTAGFSVVALEQGRYRKASDFRHDEYAHYFLSELVNDHRGQPNTFRRTPQEKANRQPCIGYGRCVGGGSVHFTGNYWRFHEVDFVERSRWGPMSGTGLDDWPITYADLEPYYTKAEWDLGISGEAGASPFDPPRSRPYPLPPLRVDSAGVLFERAARRLGWHPFPAPMAIASRSYQGRSGCVYCSFCKMFGCEVGAKSSSLAALIPLAERTGRCEIRAQCVVRTISVDRRGRVDGVVYFDARRREHLQKARAVVLCANGAETPRLLLMSRSSRFPNGLANSSGLVGKYLMFDTGSFCGALFEHPVNGYIGPEVTRLVHDFYDSDSGRGFYGGGSLDGRFDFQPITFALWGGLPPGSPRWGADYKRMLAEYFNRTMYVLSHTTALPLEQNSVSLDPDVKDALGLPALRVTYKNHPDDLKCMQFLQDRGMELLAAAGAQRTWGYPVEDISFSVHLMGTCRMGNDPARSVVNRFHRAHDVPNLFIVDGSSFVTSGRQQPTATIQALAYRAADAIVGAAKKGELG